MHESAHTGKFSFMYVFFAALSDGRATVGFSPFVCLQKHRVCCECVCVWVSAADTLTQYSVKREALAEGNMASQLSIMPDAHYYHTHTKPTIH